MCFSVYYSCFLLLRYWKKLSYVSAFSSTIFVTWLYSLRSQFIVHRVLLGLFIVLYLIIPYISLQLCWNIKQHQSWNQTPNSYYKSVKLPRVMRAVTHTLTLFTCLGWLNSAQRSTWQFVSMNNEAVMHRRPEFSNITSVLGWHTHTELFLFTDQPCFDTSKLGGRIAKSSVCTKALICGFV